MLSAHGSAPDVIRAAHAGGGYVVDAVCPLVTKVHHEVKVRAGQGFRIIYVGHEGHEEAVGTMAVAPEAIWRVEDAADVAALPDTAQPPALLAQTTLSQRDWAGVVERPASVIPDLWQPGRSDPLLRHHQPPGCAPGDGPRCGALVVIGSANSSNTQALDPPGHRGRLSPGLPGQRGRGAARRPHRHRGGDGRSARPPRSWSRRSSPACPPATGSRR